VDSRGLRAHEWKRTVRSVIRGELGSVPVHIKSFAPDTFCRSRA
jgi:hypothetical protein